MESYRINQLPVVDGGHLVGIVTDRDVRDAFPSVFDSASHDAGGCRSNDLDPGTVPIEIVMTPDAFTLAPHDTLVDATRLMRRERIGAIPIVERGRLVGIVTRSDVLDAFADDAGRDARMNAAIRAAAVSTAMFTA